MVRHALSFGKNPVFKDFIEVICSDEPIVLVLGAGVSIESGLPTWSGLLDQLGKRIEGPPYLIDLLQAEESDPSKRAALTLAKLGKNSGISNDIRILETLYETLPRDGGNLLLALVGLIKRLGPRVKVITLNYDDCLEYALIKDGGYGISEVHPYALSGREEWKLCTSGVAILHVHGFLTRGKKPGSSTGGVWRNAGPIILGEGEYIQYGSTVQKLIRKEAERAHLVFVGTSLTDANITHPLSARYARGGDKKSKRSSLLKSAFALLVPSERAASKVYRNMEESARRETSVAELANEYFKMRSQHIKDTYGITTLSLNSFSQVTQVILEAALAIEVPDLYFSENDDSSIRYGKRYRRIMKSIYARLAIIPGGIAPGGEDSRLLSDELEKALNARVRPVLEGFFEESIRFYKRSKSRFMPQFLGDRGVAKARYDEERFGLYLWLRSALAEGGDDDFEVFIAGASSYSRRDGLTMSQRSAVSPNSIYASARAVASGTMETFSHRYEENAFGLPGEPLDRPWNMHWSVPISVSESDLGPSGGPWRVNVGALVLQSNKYNQRCDEEFDPVNHSLMALVLRNPVHSRQLSECLAQCGTDFVAKFPDIGYGD